MNCDETTDLTELPPGDQEFKVLLDSPEDVRNKLEEFKASCEAHEKHRGRRCRKRYYHLGLMALIDNETTKEELERLLKNNVRTFLFDLSTNKVPDVARMIDLTKSTISEYESESPSNLPLVTGLALQLHGDCCRLGRLRNNSTVFLKRCDVLTLTTDEEYSFCGFKEIVWVCNLSFYIKKLQLGDVLMIGQDVQVRIVKYMASSLCVQVEAPGLITSFDYVELPDQCYTPQEELPDLFSSDLDLARVFEVHYIVMPQIRCKQFIRMLRTYLKGNFDFKLIGTIDLEFVSSKMLDVMGIINLLDYVWIPNRFSLNYDIQDYIAQDVVPLARGLKKPIIGSIPLERCSDFKRFENHDFLWKIDAMFIKKSPWCSKYPLIVKKLLPVRDFRTGAINNCKVPCVPHPHGSYTSIVNFIITTISSVECEAIFIQCRCEAAATALARVEIYCPVYVLMLMGEDEAEDARKLKLARALNLRRNTLPFMYTKQMLESNQDPFCFAIQHLRQTGCLDTGDFVITLDVRRDNQTVSVEDQDVVALKAFYLPPPPIANKFKFA